MKRILIIISVSLFALSVGALADPLQDKGNKGNKGNKGGKPNNEAQEEREDREDLRDLQDGLNLVSGLISQGEARDIARSVGATGYKPLPNGIRKNLARGKPLPPGIAKSRMPGGMNDRLPKKDGYEWRDAGRDLLLVQAGTNIVADVLEDVFD
jgi:hypothetical protein